MLANYQLTHIFVVFVVFLFNCPGAIIAWFCFLNDFELFHVVTQNPQIILCRDIKLNLKLRKLSITSIYQLRQWQWKWNMSRSHWARDKRRDERLKRNFKFAKSFDIVFNWTFECLNKKKSRQFVFGNRIDCDASSFGVKTWISNLFVHFSVKIFSGFQWTQTVPLRKVQLQLVSHKLVSIAAVAYIRNFCQLSKLKHNISPGKIE